MPKRKLYTVSSSKDGGWEARETDAGVIASGARKPEVVRAAAKVARQQDSASLRIQRRDGKILEERTYPHGSIRDGRRDKAMETQMPEGDKMPDPQGPDEVPPQEPTEEGLPEDGEEDTPAPDPEALGE